MPDDTLIGDMDWDRDGLTNSQEFTAGRNPLIADADAKQVGNQLAADALSSLGSPELDTNMKTVREGAEKATEAFRTGIAEADGVSEMVTAFGKYVSDLGGPIGDFGDGLGDTLENGIAKGFHTEGVGTGFLGETAEGAFAVLGEAAETIAEATSGLGEAAMVATGGVIEAVGGTASNLRDAGAAVLDGDIGTAADHTYEAVKSALGIVGTTIDTGKAVVHAGGEVIEGVVETGVEVVEGVVEMGIGLGRNVADGAVAVGGALADGADYVSEAASDTYDAVSDAASDAYDSVSEFFSY